MPRETESLTPTFGFEFPELPDLNAREINWDVRGILPCQECRGLVLWPPGAESYASTMRHYEQSLGFLATPTSSVCAA